MKVWHSTSDAPRFPAHPSRGESVNLRLGTWPVESGQEVWIEFRVIHANGASASGRVDATWDFNRDENSYWYVNFGPFQEGDQVEYQLLAKSPREAAAG